MRIKLNRIYCLIYLFFSSTNISANNDLMDQLDLMNQNQQAVSPLLSKGIVTGLIVVNTGVSLLT